MNKNLQIKATVGYDGQVLAGMKAMAGRCGCNLCELIWCENGKNGYGRLTVGLSGGEVELKSFVDEFGLMEDASNVEIKIFDS